jgi:hypothetical protein
MVPLSSGMKMGTVFTSETSVSVYKSVFCQSTEGHDLVITMKASRYLFICDSMLGVAGDV